MRPGVPVSNFMCPNCTPGSKFKVPQLLDLDSDLVTSRNLREDEENVDEEKVLK
jgi:hypothetical protein